MSAAMSRVLLCAWTSPSRISLREARGLRRPSSGRSRRTRTSIPTGSTYPVFVKPARSGSSFGVSKVSREEELLSAVETARQYDSKVLIEEAVVGSEVGCAILGNDPDLVAGEVDRIALSHGFFRIHQEDAAGELVPKTRRSIVPADISTEARELVQETAKALYRALGCRGLARVDMFLKEDGTVVLNEVNTLPGMTSYSRYPRMMAAAGVPLPEVIDRIVSLALQTEADESTILSLSTSLVPGIRWDAKYATWDNFTGKPVDGYLANRIVGSMALCAALEKAQVSGGIARLRLASLGWVSPSTRRGLLSALVKAGGRRPEEATALSEHRPTRDDSKRDMWLAKSGHSRGSTVDLTLFHLATGELAPMGGDHDLMDPISHHGAKGITPVEARNRQLPLFHHGGLRLYSVRLRMVALLAAETNRIRTPILISPSGRPVRCSASELTAHLGAELVGPDVSIEGASIDSRTIRPGQLYVPIVAARDGHAFIPAALEAGAPAYLTAREPVGGTAIRVRDTAAALLSLGAFARGRVGGAIGITGSVGKTTTKDLLAGLSGVNVPHRRE